MVNSCIVWKCHNRDVKVPGGKKRHFYDIPKVITTRGPQTEALSAERRALWLSRIMRKDYNPDPNARHNKVCSDHFITGIKSELYDKNNPDWAPSLKLTPVPDADVAEMRAELSLNRFDRARSRGEKKVKRDAAEALIALHQQVESPDESADVPNPQDTERVVCTMIKRGELEPEIAEPEPEIMGQMRKELQRLTQENMELKEKIEKTKMTPESLEGNNEKVRHLTGLDYVRLMAIFNFLSPRITESSRTVLTRFEKVLLVLMKMRLNLSVQDLAYRFSVSTGCVSKTFGDVIHIMYVMLRQFIHWPDREQLHHTMPMDFRKNFGLKVSIIIDCFEIFIERPSNLNARAKTWSNYKHHNTIKFLIGITPQGSVSFISESWGGRASDKHITENCGLLDKLLPGDLILADRGFDIQDSVGLMCAEVKIPAFTKGRQQLSALEVESTRKIAHSRIHVERVIGLVRNKYTILQDTIPIDYLDSHPEDVPTVDKIVTVCCALSNFCNSVVPFD